MRKRIITELTKWLSANLILPLVAPFVVAVICLFGGGIVGRMAIDSSMFSLQYYADLLNVLLVNGVYSFLGITFLISLYYDYGIAKNTIKGIWSFLYFIILFALGSLFLHSLGLIIGETTYTPEERKVMLIWFSVFSIVYSIPFKIIIIKRKINREIYSSL